MNPLSLLGLIPGLFTTINGVTNAIANERLKLIDAKTEQARIATQERITSLEAKRDVLVAESGRSNINAFVRSSIGASVAFLLAKIYVWDKALGDYTHGHTDPLDANLWSVIMATIGFYFLYEGAVNVTRIAKS